MARLNHDEFDRRVEEAMEPPKRKEEQPFSPSITTIRQSAAARKQLPAATQQKQLPVAS